MVRRDGQISSVVTAKGFLQDGINMQPSPQQPHASAPGDSFPSLSRLDVDVIKCKLHCNHFAVLP